MWKIGLLNTKFGKWFASFTLQKKLPIPTDCPNPSLVDNGLCNDDANNAECNYDGGDCCGSCVVKQYCSDCQCLGGENTGNGVSSPSIGDGVCHDDNNIAACDYDGLDCCSVSTDLIGNDFCNDEANIAECNYDGYDCCKFFSIQYIISSTKLQRIVS